jgi:hypothetical protein
MTAFPIGSLDKTKRFLKTETGWVSVKKLQGEQVVLPPVAASAPAGAKYASIQEAQTDWFYKKITHTEYLQEQAALYASGVLSKEHRSIKMR